MSVTVQSCFHSATHLSRILLASADRRYISCQATVSAQGHTTTATGFCWSLEHTPRSFDKEINKIIVTSKKKNTPKQGNDKMDLILYI